MKDKKTMNADKVAEQRAQRDTLNALLDSLDGVTTKRFAELLGVKSRGTVYTWLADPEDGGVQIPGPVWKWVLLLRERPEMLHWLERVHNDGAPRKTKKQRAVPQQERQEEKEER